MLLNMNNTFLFLWRICWDHASQTTHLEMFSDAQRTDTTYSDRWKDKIKTTLKWVITLVCVQCASETLKPWNLCWKSKGDWENSHWSNQKLRTMYVDSRKGWLQRIEHRILTYRHNLNQSTQQTGVWAKHSSSAHGDGVNLFFFFVQILSLYIENFCTNNAPLCIFWCGSIDIKWKIFVCAKLSQL